LHSAGHGVEHRDQILETLSAFAGHNSGNDPGTVFYHLPGMKRTFTSGYALNDKTRVFVDSNAHFFSP
jgi:hypothetical protein